MASHQPLLCAGVPRGPVEPCLRWALRAPGVSRGCLDPLWLSRAGPREGGLGGLGGLGAPPSPGAAAITRVSGRPRGSARYARGSAGRVPGAPLGGCWAVWQPLRPWTRLLPAADSPPLLWSRVLAVPSRGVGVGSAQDAAGGPQGFVGLWLSVPLACGVTSGKSEPLLGEDGLSCTGSEIEGLNTQRGVPGPLGLSPRGCPQGVLK